MTDLDRLPFAYPSEATPTGATGQRPARNPNPDPARSRRGRNNRTRGLAIQREFARDLGLVNLHGPLPEDAKSEETYSNAAFVAQIKSGARFPGWMAAELGKLPRRGGRTPILGIAETPGKGRKRRRLVVLDAEDWVALHVGTVEP